jgi:hypothetical protein
VKAVDAIWFPKYAARVHEQVTEQQRFAGLFGPDVVLLPVPRAAPRVNVDSWVAQRLAVAFQQTGLGCAVWTGLQRKHSVRKSATAVGGARPSVWEHYESLALEPSITAVRRLVLIDDVVTKGRTLLAAAMRVREALPGAEVRAFALLRTMGRIADVDRLLDPCQGEIRWAGDDARRDP